MSVPSIFDDKLRERRRERALPNFAAFSFLLDAMADEMIERLTDVSRTFEDALVIGTLNMRLADHLQASGARVTMLEPSLGVASARSAVHGREDALPFPDGQFDLVLSCGTLDSVNDLPGALIALRRALRPDGLCLVSFIGAGSLPMLRSALRVGESERPAQRLHPQVDVRALGDLLQRAGFAMPVADHQGVAVRYGSVLSLMHDLRGMGAAQCLASPPPPLTRSALMVMAEAFAAQAEPDGKTRETFVILHGSGWAPSPDQPRPARRGSATVSLADALKGPRSQ
ncbi:methyltransferase domain-containing protein [Sphingobium sp. CR28]|uniref:methyltransferase domain-containing protein n=1 Tax=Sphingobium sp. CR28 TaxID=3400272 RepID=UPI003FF03C13